MSIPALLALALLGPPSLPLQTDQGSVAPPQDAGTFHVATGTWTRPGRQGRRLALGPDVLYCNLNASAVFQPLDAPDWVAVDTGRVPSSTSPTPNVGLADSYTVNGFEVAYCTREVSANVDVSFRFFDSYRPCTPLSQNPAPVLDLRLSGVLPGSGFAGVARCWIVTIDLEGTTDPFSLAADADGVFDDDPALDSFGFGIQFHDVTNGPSGPLSSGQCPPAPKGGGTVFNNTAGPCTGLGTSDAFYIDDPSGVASGCTNFGGCAQQSPFGSFFLRLHGDVAPFGTNYCTANPNSTGAPSQILIAGSSNPADQDVTLSAEDLPPSIPGLFFFGTGQLSGIPFGDGLRCVGGTTTRIQPPAFSGGGMGDPPQSQGTAARQLDFNAPYASALVSGTTLNFQFWYRDPMGGPAGFNTSDGIEVSFQ